MCGERGQMRRQPKSKEGWKEREVKSTLGVQLKNSMEIETDE